MKTIKTKKYLIFFLLSLFFSFGISEFLILTGKIKISVLDNYPTYTPSPSEVVISFYGGLGNNMFQYAAGLSYAKQHNKSLKIAGNFKNISKVFFVSENDYVKGWPLTEKAYIERDASLDFQDAMNNSSFQYLNGYFQDENIFKNQRDLILKVFKFKNELTPKNKALADKIKTTNSVSIHIRRGDYLGDYLQVCNDKYYYDAIKEMNKHIKNPYYFIFSDDIKWVKENMKFPKNTVFVDNNNPNYEELNIMSKCKNFIMSNSTFSYWAQFLSNNENKIVIAPNKWFLTKKRIDIYEKEWKLIEVESEDNSKNHKQEKI